MKLPMARLQIIGLKQHLQPTVRTLHGLGCIQVEDLSACAEVSARPWQLDEATIRQRESTTRLIAEIEGLLSILETDTNPSTHPSLRGQ
jgi:vacuolar-type H+-ATPase subunit I/STV1